MAISTISIRKKIYTCGLKADKYKCESGTYLLGGVEQVVEHSGDLLGVKSNGGE